MIPRPPCHGWPAEPQDDEPGRITAAQRGCLLVLLSAVIMVAVLTWLMLRFL
jgi:hypothetical protein